MEMLVYVPSVLTVHDAMVAVYVFAAIAAIEAGIIGGLATRVGSLRKLFNLTNADKIPNNTNKKGRKAPNDPKD